MMKTNSVKNKKSKNIHKKKKPERNISGEDGEELEESSEEELDLTKECHPIGYYINDRPEMINQMFSVIKGNKLKAMLPPILKNCDVEQLKLQCLDQLLGMSTKRINCLLEGEILETSSESDVPSDDGRNSSDSSSSKSSNSSSSSKSRHKDERDKERKRRKRKRKSVSSDNELSKTVKIESETNEQQQPEQGKTLLELLELEMRARAIRALLEKGNDADGCGVQASTSENKTNNDNVQVVGDVVDLTNCEDDEDFPLPSNKKSKDTDVIDEKVNNFEMKLDKPKEMAKSNDKDDEEKKRKLRAELELRNKLFKKKIYRTRQQRMEGMDEEKEESNSQDSESNVNRVGDGEVVIKEEPKEPEEVIIEDPEEGEISTDEDEVPVLIKQEPEVVETVVEEEQVEETEKQSVEEAETIVRTDVEFITSYPSENIVESTVEPCPDIPNEEEITTEIDEGTSEQEANENTEENTENASWLSRWLQNNDVQKVVKSSKICSKVKKRMINVQKNNKEEGNVTPSYDVNSDSNSTLPLKNNIVEGSVEEYQKLVSNVVTTDETCSENCYNQNNDGEIDGEVTNQD